MLPSPFPSTSPQTLRHPSQTQRHCERFGAEQNNTISSCGLTTKMKYVLVTGGVVSGLGKGVTASSIGVLLKSCGYRVTSIKIGKQGCCWGLLGIWIGDLIDEGRSV